MNCFSIVFLSENRIYCCDNEADYINWISVLKKETGYTTFFDIKGKGKFGLA